MYPRKRDKVIKNAENADRKIAELNDRFVADFENVRISPSLPDNEKILKELFDECSDFVIRHFRIERNTPALAVFIDGLVDTKLVNEALQSMMTLEGVAAAPEELQSNALPVSQIQKAGNYKDFLLSVLGGDTGVIVHNSDTALLLGIRGGETRSVSEPETEAVVRGPREGFVENLRTNTSMIRRKLKTPHLKMKSMTVGQHTNTSLVLAYIDSLADPAMVEEVVGRLQKIKTDAILESGYVEEFIQDSTFSPFPQVQYTERPDTLTASLLNGRIAILVDGTPMALIVPAVFIDFLQASEDMYERFQISTLIRWLRYLFLMISLFTPALYVAVATFHQEMLPTQLLMSISAAREAIPFPAVVEALLMEVTFEALREAGIRLPKTVGQAVSILGALVIGQAAVEAGIVSAPMVIVVSITGIASFTIPRFNGAIAVRMLRFPLIILASLFGLFGIVLGFIFILGHMANLRSFGVPYLSPLGPLSSEDTSDVFMRAPIWMARKRHSYLPVLDTVRTGEAVTEELTRQQGQKGADIPHDKESEGS